MDTVTAPFCGRIFGKPGARVMGIRFSKTVAGAALAGLIAAVPIQAAQAQEWSANTPSQQGADKGQYIPNIWVDPDGCEHWVMDDGAEGYMTPHVTREGIPVCRRGNVCGVMSSDQFFATNSYQVTVAGQQRLKEFFQGAQANSFVITGHTDSRASDAYNMRLSLNRAHSVANIAKAAGAKVAEVRGYGERQPAASNASAAGMAKNRRVEIICIR